MENVCFYQPHSGMGSSFPHRKLLQSSQFRTSSFSKPSPRQLSLTGRSKPADGISRLREKNDVEGGESSDDELPSLRKLLSPVTQARQSSLKASTPPSAFQDPSRSRFLNPPVQMAESLAPSPSATASTPRKSLFKNVPAWSFLQPPPAPAPAPSNQAKVNDDAVHNSSIPVLARSDELAVLPHGVPSRCMSRSSVKRDPMSGNTDGRRTDRGDSQENPIDVDDDDDEGHLMIQSSHASSQMIVDNPGLGCENTDMDADGADHADKVAAKSGLGDAAILQYDNRSTIATSPSFSPEIPESDSGTTLDGERQLHSPLQEDPIANPSGKRSRSLSGSDRPDGRGSDWVFDVFAEDGSEGDGSASLKRARSSPHPLEGAENRSPSAAAVKGVQMSGSAHSDRPSRSDQEYSVHQVVGESGSEYEITALTKMWLPKVSVDPKLVRKYRAEQRAATTKVRTRWSPGCKTRAERDGSIGGHNFQGIG
ncbi:hypothetical protein GJ744_007090 [Endocarpon pusillum]|uniref:Uncharacterized protein n=1 Tax=Endocarpon pusillum TaxID=364733 RepID=A0A8H7E7X3_9EURO|nr:hypothetical protein GJ744_007090 [Endocarpon pusillum]